MGRWCHRHGAHHHDTHHHDTHHHHGATTGTAPTTTRGGFAPQHRAGGQSQHHPGVSPWCRGLDPPVPPVPGGPRLSPATVFELSQHRPAAGAPSPHNPGPPPATPARTGPVPGRPPTTCTQRRRAPGPPHPGHAWKDCTGNPPASHHDPRPPRPRLHGPNRDRDPPGYVDTIQAGPGTAPTPRGSLPASRWPRVDKPDRPRDPPPQPPAHAAGPLCARIGTGTPPGHVWTDRTGTGTPPLLCPCTGLPAATRARIGTGTPTALNTQYRRAPGPPPHPLEGRSGPGVPPLRPQGVGGIPRPAPRPRSPWPGPGRTAQARRRRSSAAEPTRFRRHLQAAAGTAASPATPLLLKKRADLGERTTENGGAGSLRCFIGRAGDARFT